MAGKKGFTLIELMVVIAIIAIIAAIAIPGLLQSSRASNERSSSTSLKTLTSAEVDFRSNDRDGNRTSDFWTYNVSGLYCATSALVPGSTIGSPTDPPVKLIELGLAAADVNGTSSGPEDQPVASFAVQSPKGGYWYQALLTDQSVAAPDNVYRVDTDGASPYGAVHNLHRFGFSCWPDNREAGKFAYIVNENNAIYRRPLTASVRPSTNTPPGVATLADLSVWPTDTSLKSFWGKMD